MSYGIFNNDERRRDVRYERDDMGVRVSAGTREIPEATVIDISLSGLGVYLPIPVQMGQSLRFQLDLPNGPVSGVGIVRWAVPHHLGYKSGLQVVQLGWFHRRRLKGFLEPESINFVGLFDNFLAGAAAAVIVAVFLDYFGVDLSFLGRLLP